MPGNISKQHIQVFFFIYSAKNVTFTSRNCEQKVSTNTHCQKNLHIQHRKCGKYINVPKKQVNTISHLKITHQYFDAFPSNPFRICVFT